MLVYFYRMQILRFESQTNSSSGDFWVYTYKETVLPWNQEKGCRKQCLVKIKMRGNRDITLLTKVLIVKAMVFPVVMYGCESWTKSKAECEELMLSNCGAREDS